MKHILILALLLSCAGIEAQHTNKYDDTYTLIEKMLTGETELKFKEAVFAVEKAYNERLDIEGLNKEIARLTQLANLLSTPDIITYNKKDKNSVVKHAALFRVMTDSVFVSPDSMRTFVHAPYSYNFDDPFAQKEWSSMFVSKLLETGKGNCHSLPYLYKIIAEELNIPCYPAFAPNHIYIKLFSEQTGWYNCELTSGTFPIDAWLMASGYISTDAIRNGLYMDTLSTRQAVANCLVDLAHGYRRKFGSEDPAFVIRCCNTALKHHPVNVSALLTKAEAQKKYISRQVKERNAQNPEALFADASIAAMYSDMEQTYLRLHQLGYKRMPAKMYFEWINLLKNESEKYTRNR